LAQRPPVPTHDTRPEEDDQQRHGDSYIHEHSQYSEMGRQLIDYSPAGIIEAA
jgi:hypothetical protein